jgi:hypothetical protein
MRFLAHADSKPAIFATADRKIALGPRYPSSRLHQESVAREWNFAQEWWEFYNVAVTKLYFSLGVVNMRWSRIISVGTSFLFGQGALQGVAA